MHASHYYRAANGSPNQALMGGYDLKFIRTETGWKIAESVQTVGWTKGNWQFHHEIAASLGTPDLS
jgi:hypothetical protein